MYEHRGIKFATDASGVDYVCMACSAKVQDPALHADFHAKLILDLDDVNFTIALIM